MKNKKIILVVAIVIVLIVILVSLLINKGKYELKMPDLSKIVSVNLEKSPNGILLSNIKDVENIYNIINAKGRKTNIKSNKDLTNVNNSFKIDFNYEASVALSLIMYEENGRYYILQADNGVYNFTKKEFDQIAKYLN